MTALRPHARLLLVALVGLACLFPSCAERPQRPDVLLLVVDTLRADRLGEREGQRYTTEAHSEERVVYDPRDRRVGQNIRPAPQRELRRVLPGLQRSSKRVRRGEQTDRLPVVVRLVAVRDARQPGV